MMERNSASFRDEGGFVFHHDGTVFRHIDKSFQDHYEFLMTSGLYEDLTSRGLLLKHREEEIKQFSNVLEVSYKVIRPEHVPFISYPYEWSFHQLQDAALATLEIQKCAIEHGMILKDAPAYNIQFVGGKPCLIDTLSFLKLGDVIEPWVAYKQFCEQFLAPLALMSYFDNRMNLLLRSFLDGVPVELASQMLPWKSNLSLGLFVHLHLHAKFYRKYSKGAHHKGTRSVSKYALLGLNESLRKSIRRLRPHGKKTEWADYYDETANSEYARTKKEIIEKSISTIKPKLVLDIGANNGEYSRLFSNKNIDVISLDIDPSCVDENYRIAMEKGESHIHPLLLNINDPSPALGWANEERPSFLKRVKPDFVVAFAIVHHLSITHNIGFELIAKLLSGMGKYLMIEFLEREDRHVTELLTFKKITHDSYSRLNFENVFSKFYRIIECHQTGNRHRIIYLMESLTEK